MKTEQGFKKLTEKHLEESSLAMEKKRLLLEILDANYGIKRENSKEKVRFKHHQLTPEEQARTNPDLIKLDVLAKRDDPYNWLDYATHYLATLNISDHDRLNVLRRHIPSKLIMWDRELEKNGLTGNYTVYLEQLKKKLLTSEMICGKIETTKRQFK